MRSTCTNWSKLNTAAIAERFECNQFYNFTYSTAGETRLRIKLYDV